MTMLIKFIVCFIAGIRSFKSAYYMIKVSLSLIIDRLSIKKIHQPKSK